MTDLGSAELAEALDVAARIDDLDGVAAATTLRRRFSPEVAATALTQTALRRRGHTKFGADAARLFFTRDGLEQATRPGVARWRAQRFAAAGVTAVVDLGCGIGADALAFAAAGLHVTAVEADAETAEVARANLTPYGDRAEVIVGDAVELAPRLLADPATAVFCDPARRTGAGRTWRPEDVSPPWSFVTELLATGRPVCVKAGPGLPYRFLPDTAEAVWVADHHDVVEVGLWRLPDTRAGDRRALLLPGGESIMVVDPEPALATGPVGAYVHEPHGAAIRAGAVPQLAVDHGLRRVGAGIAYLTGDVAVSSPWLTGFAVLESLPYNEKTLRAWVREHRVGTLEIKKRGIELDPAALRRRLKPSGPASATMIITPTPDGARTLVVRRAVGSAG